LFIIVVNNIIPMDFSGATVDLTVGSQYSEHKVKHTLLLEEKMDQMILNHKLVPTPMEALESLFDTILMSVFRVNTIPQNGH